ncbi:hypothetical protein AK812_SmicGene24042 [Symbiodinium microadriaticum]|uniref:Uncharacterized protein n=1 Tax=Symbiodinium microadriaticum TaxID=2951 RepID=A0A1Q9DFT0_SYMMI|nr:hypothetical protein AK812_SmicGene24042 [Symbiodinium microadriaticum]
MLHLLFPLLFFIFLLLLLLLPLLLLLLDICSYSAATVMLGRLIPFALIAQCHAYARVSIPVDGQVMGGESFEIHAEMMKEVHSGLGKLEVLGECCADPGEASEVSDAINSNQVYGTDKEIDKEIFKVGSTECRQMRELEQKNPANKGCSYFFVFENTKHADHGYAANCVPAQMCKDDVVGMTKGKVATYGVVMQTFQFDGMVPSLHLEEKIPAVKSFNKCVDDASMGYLFVFGNKYWSGDKSTVDLSNFMEEKEKQTKIKAEKKQAAEEAKAAAAKEAEKTPDCEEASDAVGVRRPCYKRRLTEQDQVLV